MHKGISLILRIGKKKEEVGGERGEKQRRKEKGGRKEETKGKRNKRKREGKKEGKKEEGKEMNSTS